MSEIVSVFFLSLLASAIVVYLIRTFIRTKELISPWTLFLMLFLLDILIPAILYIGFEEYRAATYWAVYIPYFQAGDFLRSVIVFIASVCFFGFGYFGVGRILGAAVARKSGHKESVLGSWKLNATRVYWMMALSGGIYLASIMFSIQSHGSFLSYLEYKFMRIYGQKLVYDTQIETMVFLLAPIMRTFFSMLVGVLFYYRKRYKHGVLWGIIFPVIGLISASSTFLRGSLLLYFFMLLMVEIFRIKESYHGAESEVHLKTLSKITVKTFLFVFLALVFFSGYGAVRNYRSSEVQKSNISFNDAVLFEAKRFLHGEGLIGLTWIIQSFPGSAEYLKGKTFVDMLLLPVPRSLYPSKPLWYGVADITRAMGSPESTQDAVTMPGELYANFGYLGIPFMSVYGAVFGLFWRFKQRPRFKFVYATLLPGIMVTTFWMSFTGFVNSILSIPVLLISLVFIISRESLPVNNLPL